LGQNFFFAFSWQAVSDSGGEPDWLLQLRGGCSYGQAEITEHICDSTRPRPLSSAAKAGPAEMSSLHGERVLYHPLLSLPLLSRKLQVFIEILSFVWCFHFKKRRKKTRLEMAAGKKNNVFLARYR